MKLYETKRSLAGREVYFKASKATLTKLDIVDLTPDKLYKIVTHQIYSTLIVIKDDDGFMSTTQCVTPAARLDGKLTWSLKSLKKEGK